MVLSDREQRTSKVSKSHALAVRLTDFDLFSESHEAYTFSHEFYKILTISSRIFIFYLFSTYNSIIWNMKRALPLWEKCLSCVWCNYLLYFLLTNLYSETPKAQTFLLLLFRYGVFCEEDEECSYLQMQI